MKDDLAHHNVGSTPAPSKSRAWLALLVLRFVFGMLLIAVGVELITAGNEAADMGGLAVIGGTGVLIVAYLLIASAVVALIARARTRR